MALAIYFSQRNDFCELCVELKGLCEEMVEEHKVNKGVGTSTAIHFKADTGSLLSSKEQKELLHLLTEGPGSKHIPSNKARFLTEIVGAGGRDCPLITWEQTTLRSCLRPRIRCLTWR